MSLHNHSNTIFAWVVWGLAALFYCYEYLLRILPSVMTQYLRSVFMINGFAFGNLAAVYYYAYIPMQLPAGILMDRINPRKLLTLACLICAVGNYWFAQPNLYIAYLGRFLVGIGSAFAFVGVMKLSTIWFSPSYFSFITGLTTSLGMIGAMIGNITLSSLVNLIGSYELLMVTVMTGIVLTLLMGFIIPEHPSHKFSNKVHPLHDSSPLVEIYHLFKDRQMWLLGIIGCCLFLSLTAFAEIWGIPYLSCHYKLTNHVAANYNSLVFLGWAIGGPLMGTLSSQFKTSNQRLKLIIGGAFLGAICFSIILYLPSFARYYLGLLLFLFGLFSSVQVIIFTMVRDFYASNISGTAFAVANLLIMLGGGISPPLIGYLLDTFSIVATTSKDLVAFSEQEFTYALSFLPCAFLLAGILSFFVKKPFTQAT